MRPVTAISLVVALAAAVLIVLTEREQPRPPEELNAIASGPAALVVYHPGLSDFPDSVVRAFAGGLAERGWRVRIASASRKTPVDLSQFQLVVLASPVYWWMPARPLTNYVRRVGDLGGRPTVVLLTAAGQGDRALDVMRRLVERRNGHIKRALVLYTMRPNDEARISKVPNRTIALELAHAAGAAIPPSR